MSFLRFVQCGMAVINLVVAADPSNSSGQRVFAGIVAFGLLWLAIENASVERRAR